MGIINNIIVYYALKNDYMANYYVKSSQERAGIPANVVIHPMILPLESGLQRRQSAP